MVMLKPLLLKWKSIEIKREVGRGKQEVGILKNFGTFKKKAIFAVQWRRGRAARLGSAKAPTPVRIRTMPLKPSRKLGGFFMENF